MILILTAFRYETESFSAPIMSIYLPAFRSDDDVKIKETCFGFPALNENDSSLNDPVEFPRSPVGVKVPAATISIFWFIEVRTYIDFNF